MFAAFLQNARPCTSHRWCCVPSFNGATLHCRGPAEEGRPRPGQAQRATGESAAVFLSLKGYKQWPQSKRSRPDPGWVAGSHYAMRMRSSYCAAQGRRTIARAIVIPSDPCLLRNDEYWWFLKCDRMNNEINCASFCQTYHTHCTVHSKDYPLRNFEE